MENRRKYFLRGPVEIQLRALATGIETLSNEIHEPCKTTCIVVAQKIRETITEIIREDNHQITSMVDAWGVINDKINNPKK
jgi:hypothetical protein